jgi:hypothetical protein
MSEGLVAAATEERDDPVFTLDEEAETPEAVIDGFVEWIYALRMHDPSCATYITQAEGLMNVVFAM